MRWWGERRLIYRLYSSGAPGNGWAWEDVEGHIWEAADTSVTRGMEAACNLCARPPVNHCSSEMSPACHCGSTFLPLIMAPINKQQVLVAYPITIR